MAMEVSIFFHNNQQLDDLRVNLREDRRQFSIQTTHQTTKLRKKHYFCRQNNDDKPRVTQAHFGGFPRSVWVANEIPSCRLWTNGNDQSMYSYNLAHWKWLIRNWFIWELIRQLIFFLFCKWYSQRVEVFGGFLQKDRFFFEKDCFVAEYINM